MLPLISMPNFGLVIVSFQADSHACTWIGVQIPLGIGLGINFTAPQFPALAPLHPRLAAQALALFTFASSFGQVSASASIWYYMKLRRDDADNWNCCR